jgi:hypothetical protein
MSEGETTLPATEPRSRFRKERVFLWQAALALALAVLAAVLHRGSPLSIACGALFLAASFLLQDLAFSAAFRRQRHPAIAVGLLLLKFAIVLGLGALGLRSGRIEPLSFALGATTLLLAILAETWYAERRSRPRGPSTREQPLVRQPRGIEDP